MKLRRIDNGNGRVTAMTLITPLRPGWTLWQRLVLLYWRLKPDAGAPLRARDSVHFGWWAILTRIPYNEPPQQPETLHHRYLIFESNFDGAWAPYVDMFGQVIGIGVNALWKGSVNYPGSRPTTGAIGYVDANQLPVDHFYAAYPEATCAMVLAALRLREQVDAFQSQSEGFDDEQWADAYGRFVRGIQRRL